MLDAGAVREVGYISSIKRGDYGFIKAISRKDEIYFRIDDVDCTRINQINEVTNSFIIINEKITFYCTLFIFLYIIFCPIHLFS
jgi:hypothetical protein